MALSPRAFALVLLAALAAAAAPAQASDRPKLPRGRPCARHWEQRGRADAAEAEYEYEGQRGRGRGHGRGRAAAGADVVPYVIAGEELADGAAVVPDALFPDALGMLAGLPRQGRSGGIAPWPLRHPALDARKRHRDASGFQHPVVRFVQPALTYGDLGGPYGGDDGWDDSRPLLDNFIRDRPLEKIRPLTAEELIRALQERQRQSEEEGGAKASAIRFGGMVGRK